MDRRTLLAIVMATLVLFIYQVLFAPKSQERAPRSGASHESEPPPSPTTSPEITSLGAENEPALTGIPGHGPVTGSFLNVRSSPDSVPAPLPVEASTHELVLSPTGGSIVRWALRSYTDASEQPADLVGDPARGLFRLGVGSPRAMVDLSTTIFTLAESQSPEATEAHLSARDSAGATVLIDYRFPKDEYEAEMEITIDGFPNVQGDAFLHLEFPRGLPILERSPQQDHQSSAAVAMIGRHYLKHGEKGKKVGWSEVESGVVHWVGMRSKYFLTAIIPEGAPDGTVVMNRASEADRIRNSLKLPLALSGPTQFRFRMYAGPLEYSRLENYEVGLEKAVDLGWTVLVPFSRLLLKFFQAVHTVVPNYGLVILVLSILVKVLFYPLTKKSMDSMRQMQLLKPEMDRMNEKYKDNPQRRNQAMLELYKKHRINPMGGCLPILIQMPVFIALYNVFNTAIELRKAPFFLWIDDLSAPDRVGSVLGFPLHVLPLVMAATTIWQQKLTPTDPRQAMLMYLMPVVMTIFFYTLPSGLVFYWTVNNLMQIGQQLWMNRSKQVHLAAA